MSDQVPIPVTVIGGYLGAGKTTLLNHILRHNGGLKIAVLVNDFGAINIDAHLIARHDGDTISLTNGCICCSLANGFFSALTNLRTRDTPPEHIIVEASGVADPFKIGQYGHTPGFRLDGVLVLADAETIRARSRDKYVGKTVLRQLRGADLVVMTKSDLVNDEQRAAVRDWLVQTVPDARIIEVAHGLVPLSVLVGSGAGGGARSAGQTEDVDDPGSHLEHDTWTVEWETPVSDQAFPALVAALPAGVVRAKGFVWLAADPERRHVFQLVGKRWSLKPGAFWGPERPGTRIVLIGIPGSIDRDLIERIFDGIRADERPDPHP